MANHEQALQEIFQSLWADYTAFNPRAKRIYDVLLAHERERDASVKELVNDHVALRTFDIGKINLESVAKLFMKHGYRHGGDYVFKEKKLFAWHLEHDNERLPKVFISQLETAKLSPLVQKMAREAEAAIDPQLAQSEKLLWSRRPWAASHKIYEELLRESEYAAWMYAFGFRSNHFTINVNQLKSFKSLEDVNSFVRGQGYELNAAGGVIKGDPSQYLEQSSTLAEKARVEFVEGAFEIPSCYYEFARRYPLANGKMYQGFVAASADKIFESTNVRQT